MFRDVSLPDLTPEERAAVYTAATSTLCQLHSFDVDKLNLGDFGRKSGYCYRQVCILVVHVCACMCVFILHSHGLKTDLCNCYCSVYTRMVCWVARLT